MSRSKKKQVVSRPESSEVQILKCIRNIIIKINIFTERGFGQRYNIQDIPTEEFVLEKENYDVFGIDLEHLRAYLNVTNFQALVFAILLDSTLKNKTLSYDAISNKLNCPVLDLIFRYLEIEELMERSIIEAQYYEEDFFDSGKIESGSSEYSDFNYFIPGNIVADIIHNRTFNPTLKRMEDEELLVYFSEIITEHKFQRKWKKIYFKAKTNQYSPLCKKILELSKTNSETNILTLLWLSYSAFENKKLNLDDVAVKVCATRTQAKAFIKLYNEGKGDLIKKGLVQLCPSEIVTNHQIELTEKGKKLFFETIELRNDDEFIKLSGLLMPEEINAKTLFYNEKDGKQIEEIQEILQEQNYQKLINGLAERNMPQGLTILLYGPPGTGKTETVWQLAKKSNRTVKMVDISNIKDKWFGSTERNIKDVFTEYYGYLKRMNTAPVLLFNEADAIFGKRKDVNFSSVAQTENAMQNIILQEMEKFEGILIATTNLTNNLDPAFERRFLMKVRLNPPQPEVSIKIWKQFLPWVNCDEITTLIKSFQYTGAQIENIARKCLIHELKTGMNADIKQIIQFCDEECITQTRKKIGY